MNRGDYCPYAKANEKKYQLVIMAEDGKTYLTGRLYDWDGIQDAVREVRNLYEKHGVTHHVGYREV